MGTIPAKPPPNKFLQGVGSESRLPPVIIEGGVRYVAEDQANPFYDAGSQIKVKTEIKSGPIAEPPHELEVIQSLSERYRGLSRNDKESIPHHCKYSDLADCVLNCRLPGEL